MGSNTITEDSKTSCPEKTEQSRSQVVSQMIGTVEAKLKAEVKAKGTLADYIKLIQLQKDLAEDETTELKVTWVDPEWRESDG